MKEWLLGVAKSWTVWGGAVLVAFPEWWPMAEPYLRQVVSPEHYGKLVPLAGVFMILLRFKTNQSITEKGSK